MIISASIILFAYLLGSITSAIIICKLFSLSDPKASGSGNPGATNVMRLHGKNIAALTLTMDILKGMIPILIAEYLNCTQITIAICGFAVFMGHLFPIFFKFKGGKGVATLIGILTATHWLLGLAYIVTWLAIAFTFRYSSLSALIAALLTPIYSWLTLHNTDILTIHILIVSILIMRHHSNIRKLIAGQENKIGQRSSN